MTHRNADTRIRDAFDALRAELEAVFPAGRGDGEVWSNIMDDLDCAQRAAHDFAKLPADA